MRNIEPFGVTAYLDLLRVKRSGVRFNLSDLHGPHDQFAAFRGTLDDDDLDRIYLWFEFRKCTGGPDSKLTDVGNTADGEVRVRNFADGDAAKGKPAVDLRTASGLEPMLVAEDLRRGPLYAIDGNHRMIAQYRSGKAFDGIPVIVLTHPKMTTWAYMRDAARHWSGRRQPLGKG
jgi:hypothetical protein